MRRVQAVATRVALTLAGALMIGVVFVLYESSTGCACASFYAAQPALDILDDQVQQYAAAHQGLYPTYAEVEIWYQGLRPQLRTEHVGMPVPLRLTNNVSLGTRQFEATLTSDDVGAIGYAVSADRRSYVLVGAGEQEHWAALLGPVLLLRPSK